MDKKIIFFDIDRTIYDPDTRSIPTSTINALKQLNEREDIEIAIATGRAFYMLHIIEEIMDYINIFVLINGQIIIKDGETIYRNPIDKDDVLDVVKILDENQMKYGFLGEFDETLNIVDEKGKEAFELVDMNLPRIDPHFYQDNDIFQMWTFCERKNIEQFKNRFKNLQIVPWLGGGFDILTRGMSKKEGIKRILEIEKIPLEHAYAFGDGDNDIEMMDFIENSVAMGNGSINCKKHAKYITDDIKNDGLVKGLITLGILDDKDTSL
jgi:Cof subfamily protein (haloacid dehalogenase superfamily)